MNKVPFENIIIKDGLVRGPFGSDMKKSLFVPEGPDTVQVFTQQNIFDEDQETAYYFISKEYFNQMSRFEIKNGDFLITCDGTLGKILHVQNLKRKAVINSSLLIIRLNEALIDPNYFYYYWKFHLANVLPLRNVNSCLKHLPALGVVKAELVDLPSLPVQRGIGDFLKKYDDKIKTNNDICSKALEKMMLIYQQWFERFEFPYNGLTYKSAKGKMKKSEEFGIEIPEKWEIKHLFENDLLEIIKPGIDVFAGNKTYFSTSEIINLDYDTSVNQIDYENRESRANMQPQPFSVWFAKMKNSIKHIAFLEEDSLLDKVILSTGFTGLQCTKESFEYIFCVVSSSWFEDQKDVIASGSTQESATETTLNYMNVIIPPEDILLAFHKETEQLMKIIWTIKYESERIRLRLIDIVPSILNGTLSIK